MESGTALLGLESYDFAHTNFTFVASQLGCGGLDATTELNCMRQLPVETIVDFVGHYGDNATTPALLFAPIPDERVIFSNYTDRYVKGLVAKVPAIIGTAANEGAVLVPYADLTAGPNQTLADLVTLLNFVCPAHTTSELRKSIGLSTYRYQQAGNFSDLSPLPWLGAYHSSDLPLFDGSFVDFATGSALEIATSAVMQDYVLAFMQDPQNGLTQHGWPEYTSGQGLRFGANGTASATVSLVDIEGACYGQGTYNHNG